MECNFQDYDGDQVLDGSSKDCHLLAAPAPLVEEPLTPEFNEDQKIEVSVVELEDLQVPPLDICIDSCAFLQLYFYLLVG